MSVGFPSTTLTYLTTPWAAPASSDITIMFWGYLNTRLPAAYRSFIAAEPNIILSTYTDGATLDWGTVTYDYFGVPRAKPMVNSWFHMAVTVANYNNLQRFVQGFYNGKQFVSQYDNSAFAAFTKFTVGNWGNGTTFAAPLNGQIRDVRVWGRALEPWEITREMTSARPFGSPQISGLLLWSPFNDDKIYDRSGNGHVWTQVGTNIQVNGGGVQLQSFPAKPKIPFLP